MEEGLKFVGEWTILSENLKTGEKKKIKFCNKITQGFYDKLHIFLNYDQETGVDIEALNLTRLAVGDDETTAMRADTSLYNEIDRVSLVSKGFSNTQYLCKAVLGADEGNPTGEYIKELGIFANAGDTVGDGTLISRAVTNIRKNTNIRLTLSWSLKGSS